jgi:hypothetical protein
MPGIAHQYQVNGPATEIRGVRSTGEIGGRLGQLPE